MTFKLSRRTMLKGLLAGGVVSIGLPPLEAFLNTDGTAYADSSFPTRFGVFFWGNGLLTNWYPTTQGPEWVPSELLMPLMPVRNKLTVLSHLGVLTRNTAPHGSGPAGLMVGKNLVNGQFPGKTLDQVIADEIGQETIYPSLSVGVQRSDSSLSHTDGRTVNPPESSPIALFRQLFGDSFRMPGDMTAPDPRLQLRRSVLDAVRTQAGRLTGRLGRDDRARLDQHLTSIRELEARLQRLQENPPVLAACRRPDMPPEFPDVDGRPRMSEVSHAVSDLVALAMACDQTRVFFDMYSQSVGNVLYPGRSEGHHQLTHDEPEPQSEVREIIKFIMADFAYLIAALDAVQEGTETLLDHCVVLGTTDCALGRSHAIDDDYPLFLAGGANGKLKTGIHYRPEGRDNTSKLMLTLLRTMGIAAPSYGEGEGLTMTGLTAVEV